MMMRSEHPNPQAERAEWLNLNGEWEFEIDAGVSGIARGLFEQEHLSGRIQVPFCPESKLSGVENTDFLNCVWYRRDIAVPESWKGGRVLLQAGAPVSASIFFDGSESVILGQAGTQVRIYAPQGIGTQAPDAEGYCTVTLTGERTVRSVNAGSSEPPAGTATQPPAAEDPKGCASRAAVLPLLLVCLAGGCLLGKKKKRA